MPPAVRIESKAWDDPAFVRLANRLGLPDPDLALIKCARVWAHLTEQADPRTDRETIDAVARLPGFADHMIAVGLAVEDARSGALLVAGAHGKHKGRIMWLKTKRENAKKGGDAKNGKRPSERLPIGTRQAGGRHGNGQPGSVPNACPPAPALTPVPSPVPSVGDPDPEAPTRQASGVMVGTSPPDISVVPNSSPPLVDPHAPGPASPTAAIERANRNDPANPAIAEAAGVGGSMAARDALYGPRVAATTASSTGELARTQDHFRARFRQRYNSGSAIFDNATTTQKAYQCLAAVADSGGADEFCRRIDRAFDKPPRRLAEIVRGSRLTFALVVQFFDELAGSVVAASSEGDLTDLDRRILAAEEAHWKGRGK